MGGLNLMLELNAMARKQREQQDLQNFRATGRSMRPMSFMPARPMGRAWEAALTALDGTKVADASVGVKKGMFRPSLRSLLNQDEERSF